MLKNSVKNQCDCPYDRIIAAARHLFAIRGFHQTAMADLAAEACVSVGAIYRSFPSKAEIIRAIIESDTDRHLAELQLVADEVAAGRLTVAQGLEKVILSELAHTEQALSHEILAEGHRNQAMAETIGRFCAQYRTLFRNLAAAANPRLSGEDLDGAAELLLASMFGFSHAKLSRPCMSDVATARAARRLFLRSLGADPGD